MFVLERRSKLSCFSGQLLVTNYIELFGIMTVTVLIWKSCLHDRTIAFRDIWVQISSGMNVTVLSANVMLLKLNFVIVNSKRRCCFSELRIENVQVLGLWKKYPVLYGGVTEISAVIHISKRCFQLQSSTRKNKIILLPKIIVTVTLQGTCIYEINK